jgi:hypothetical protein
VYVVILEEATMEEDKEEELDDVVDPVDVFTDVVEEVRRTRPVTSPRIMITTITAMMIRTLGANLLTRRRRGTHHRNP